jgi:hypothetical protein
VASALSVEMINLSKTPCRRQTKPDSGGDFDAGFRPDILIHAKEVIRIVLRFQLGQSFVIATVRCANAIFALAFHHEVHVCAAGSLRMERLPVILRPSSDAVAVGRIRIYPDGWHRDIPMEYRDCASSRFRTRNASRDRMRFVLTDVTNCCPIVERSLPNSSIRIGVTSKYYRRNIKNAVPRGKTNIV